MMLERVQLTVCAHCARKNPVNLKEITHFFMHKDYSNQIRRRSADTYLKSAWYYVPYLLVYKSNNFIPKINSKVGGSSYTRNPTVLSSN